MLRFLSVFEAFWVPGNCPLLDDQRAGLDQGVLVAHVIGARYLDPEGVPAGGVLEANIERQCDAPARRSTPDHAAVLQVQARDRPDQLSGAAGLPAGAVGPALG